MRVGISNIRYYILIPRLFIIRGTFQLIIPKFGNYTLVPILSAHALAARLARPTLLHHFSIFFVLMLLSNLVVSFLQFLPRNVLLQYLGR